MGERWIHLHGGPLGGAQRLMPSGQSEYVFIDDVLGKRGRYVCDEGSAGGRCWEWRGWE